MRTQAEWYKDTIGRSDRSSASNIAQRALYLGTNVVLESGFWSREERHWFRARATELGADSKLIFLDVPLGELRRRLALRYETLRPDSKFRVDLDQLGVWGFVKHH